MVADFRDFQSLPREDWKAIGVQRIKEVYQAAGQLEFPLQPVAQRALRTLEREPKLEPEALEPPPPPDQVEDSPDEPVGEEKAPAPPAQEVERPPTPKTFPEVYEVAGGHMVDGRFVRYKKGTTKPPHVWPEHWQILSPMRQAEEIRRWEEAVKKDVSYGGQPSGSGVALCATGYEFPQMRRRKSRKHLRSTDRGFQITKLRGPL